MNHDWPGNVRELENLLESVVALNRSGTITLEELPPQLRMTSPAPGLDETLFAGMPTLDEVVRRYVNHVLKFTNGNKTIAAGMLGLSRRTIYRILEEDESPIKAHASESQVQEKEEDS
jgi:transcriptional regulator of acetoin/glycerol metabolism